MNEAAKEWVAALRSGKYKQGPGQLSKSGQFCCLGVACDLFANKLGLEVKVLPSGTVQYGGAPFLPPDEIQNLLGLRTPAGRFRLADGGYTTLTDLNDERGLTFNQIADIIEKEESLWATPTS